MVDVSPPLLKPLVTSSNPGLPIAVMIPAWAGEAAAKLVAVTSSARLMSFMESIACENKGT
jgi:hypothetical protein